MSEKTRPAPATGGTWDQLLTVTQSRMGAAGAGERRKISLKNVAPNPDQPRKFFEAGALDELAASIKVHGILQPILVPTVAAPATPTRPRVVRQSPELPPAEFISREVDPILEKISAHGIHSLTERERKILEQARDKMKQR